MCVCEERPLGEAETHVRCLMSQLGPRVTSAEGVRLPMARERQQGRARDNGGRDLHPSVVERPRRHRSALRRRKGARAGLLPLHEGGGVDRPGRPMPAARPGAAGAGAAGQQGSVGEASAGVVQGSCITMCTSSSEASHPLRSRSALRPTSAGDEPRQVCQGGADEPHVTPANHAPRSKPHTCCAARV